MKKFLIFCLLIMSNYVLAQNVIDPPKVFDKDNDSLSTVLHYQTDDFLLGWNWSCPGACLDSSMYVNYSHIGYQWDWCFGNKNFLNQWGNIQNQKRIVQINQIMGNRQTNTLFNGSSIYLFPVIKVDSTDNFTPRGPNEEGGPVFGFLNRNFTIGDTNGTGTDFGRFMLYNNRLTYGPAIVLSDPWMNNAMRYLNYDYRDFLNDKSLIYIQLFICI